MLRNLCRNKLPLLFALAVLVATPVLAAPVGGGVADVLLGTTQVEWVPVNGQATMHLVVSGPDGVVETTFAAGDTPRFDLAALAGDIDGSYSWQLTASPELSAESRRLMAQARNEGSPFVPNDLPPREQLVQSGHFRVVDGGIVQPTADPEPELSIATGGGDSVGVASDGVQVMTAADQVILDDLIVDGSLCVGVDCVNGESFGFDTIRLKENNLRIKFLDTSTGSFPSNDWQITINDSTNGGPSYYRIDDVTNNRTPFTIEANTPTNTLYVDQTGRIGVGTNVPVVEVHVQDGDTPTLRLQQDGSSGFAQQIWDVAGNETNFFVRDTSNGSQIPFKIRPNHNTNGLVLEDDDSITMINGAIDITSSGDIGIGTSTPGSAIHVARSDQPGFTLQDNDGSGASSWEFELNSVGRFQINKAATGGAEVQIRQRLDGEGVETMDVDGSIEATAFNVASSRTFKTGFEPVDVTSVLERVVTLPVTKWVYKEDAFGTRHIGPMAEDFMANFGVGNDSTNISLADAAGVAFAAIQGLHQELQVKTAAVTELEAQNAELLDRQANLEARLSELQAVVSSLAEEK